MTWPLSLSVAVLCAVASMRNGSYFGWFLCAANFIFAAITFFSRNSSVSPQAPQAADEKSRDAALPSVSAPSSSKGGGDE